MNDNQKKNLAALAKYLRTVPQKMFTMDAYRMPSGNAGNEMKSRKCNTPGCALGHALDALPHIQAPRYTDDGEMWKRGEINFLKLSADAFGITPGTSVFYWCFFAYWKHTDNTPTGAAARIEWVLKNGRAPETTFEQYAGKIPLCYTP